MAIKYLRYEFVGVNAVCAVAATIVLVLSYKNGSIAQMGVFFFHIRLSLMTVMVFGVVICASVVINSRRHRTRLHLVTFHVLLNYVMAVNLFISSAMVLVAFNGDYVSKHFDEPLESPGTYIACAAMGIVIATVLLGIAAWMSYRLLIAYRDRQQSDMYKQKKMDYLRIFGAFLEAAAVLLISLEIVYVNMNTENSTKTAVIFFKMLLVGAAFLTAMLLLRRCRKPNYPTTYMCLHPILVTSIAWCLFVLLGYTTIYLTFVASKEFTKGKAIDHVRNVLAENIKEAVYLAYIILMAFWAVCALNTYTSYLEHTNSKAVRNLSVYTHTI